MWEGEGVGKLLLWELVALNVHETTPLMEPRDP